jgi:hypothetical protein
MRVLKHIVAKSPALRRLLLDHQTWCTADCCKGQAFQFSVGSIERWLWLERDDPSREIAAEIEFIKAESAGDSAIFLAIPDLESEWRADEFRAFWARFEQVFTLAVEARVKDDD